MQIQCDAQKWLQKLCAYLFNFGALAGIATLSFGLISCGGGGGGGTTGSTTPTISLITPFGIVASSVAKTLTLDGSNFVNGMTLSITNSSGAPYTITASSVASSNTLSVSVIIPTAPAGNYVTFAIKSGTTTVASTILGVASADKKISTRIQAIFNSNGCSGCHGTGGTSPNLSTAPLSSTGLISAPSTGCSQKIRVVPGDPRPTSSILIDMLQAKTGSAAALSCNSSTSRHMPQGAALAMSAVEITEVIDWVAGGAR